MDGRSVICSVITLFRNTSNQTFALGRTLMLLAGGEHKTESEIRTLQVVLLCGIHSVDYPAGR
jgi:hypothetical protein